MVDMQVEIPLQPVEKPIICSPYEEPQDHWVYDRKTGEPSRAGSRRQAGYWYKTERTGSAQIELFAEEDRDDLPLVNLLRDDVRRWRNKNYQGASRVTIELLKHWAKTDLYRRLFFCQREAVETIIYLSEIRIPGRSGRTGFKKFNLTDDDLQNLLTGQRPSFATEASLGDFFPTLLDHPGGTDIAGIKRMGCKMATGSGKTVVMSMLIAWAFCNRGHNPSSKEFPNAVLVCCPNLTVKERLQVLRPEHPDNYYAAFDLVPAKYRPLMQMGKVLVTNWHAFAAESEHKEGDRTYAVVNKGSETPETFARRVLGDLVDRMPIMVLNDEGHHCWRSKSEGSKIKLTGDERREFEAESHEATVWVEGIDCLNNSLKLPDEQCGIALCVDLSATPFYIKGSGHPEGQPFPWLVSDFGLVDAIECGVVKIPRLPVEDTTGQPDPRYFRLWEAIKDGLNSAELLPGSSKKPKPEVVYRKSEDALLQIAGQWIERFRYIEEGKPGQETVPPVLIVVCDSTDVAKLFFEKISGEREEDIVTEEDADEVLGGEKPSARMAGSRKTRKKRIVYGKGEVFHDYFANKQGLRHTVRIDSKLLAEADRNDPDKKRQDAAEELRRIVSTVGQRGQPGEHVRCVVSVSMLTEGWDANNVTQILGIRAFGSQLLCEQVVGRGLRRMDYTPDPDTGLLTEEYVDVYGIPFSVIPFKGRSGKQKQPDDKPKNHVRAMPERSAMEIRFPVVEGYAFSLKKNLIRCDIDSMETLTIQPNINPTATYVSTTVGYNVGAPSKAHAATYTLQDRSQYYESTHIQQIMFQLALLIVDDLVSNNQAESDQRRRVLRLQSRHQLFPQVFLYVKDYIRKKVDFQGENQCELGLQQYVERLVERLRDGMFPDDAKGEASLLPLLNRYKPIGTTSDVDFKTIRPCFSTEASHINQVVLDTKTYEKTATFNIEKSVKQGITKYYARNDRMGLVIPYQYQKVDHTYLPDFLIRLNTAKQDLTLVLEIKGLESEQDKAKHQAARKWVEAVNNWGELGRWAFHVCRCPNKLDEELKLLLGNLTKEAA